MHDLPAPVGQSQPEPGPYIIRGLLYNAHDIVSEFVRSRIPSMEGHKFSPHVAIGVIRHDRLCGGIVFHNWFGHSIEMSGAFDTPGWCLPDTMRRLFAYPFIQLGCVRMTTITAKNNKPARMIDEGFGFKLEGTARKGWDGKQDAMIYGMLAEECKWLDESKAAEAMAEMRKARLRWKKPESK
jgi:hypothetical protein